MSGKVSVKGLRVQFGNGDATTAITDVDFNILPSEFISLLGVSGCGKSTIINSLAGFIQPTTGEIRIDDAPAKDASSKVGVVFQNFVLFPWLTVRQNIEFGPKLKNMPIKEMHELANHYLQDVDLVEFQNFYPAQLSGGMQQRVAIARALINNPEVLLMDEPFGSLDSQTRVFMQELLLKLWDQFKKTVLFVTHDIDEAIFLSDRILVMTGAPGKIREEITVPFARPRVHDDINMQESYLSIKKKLQRILREESGRDVRLLASLKFHKKHP